jgi:hypothetical protein
LLLAPAAAAVHKERDERGDQEQTEEAANKAADQRTVEWLCDGIVWQ